MKKIEKISLEELQFKKGIYDSCRPISDIKKIGYITLFFLGYELIRLSSIETLKYFFLIIAILIFVDFIITIFIPIKDKLKFINREYENIIREIYKK